MHIKRFFSSATLSVLVALSVSVPTAYAADAKTATPTPKADSSSSSLANAGGIQSYAADNVVQPGSIVELKNADTKTVGAATKPDLAHMYGVAVDRAKLSISISNSGLKNETFVATTGTYDVLVSTQNGPIAAGDFVTMSAVNGVAMKADQDDKTVFGRAAAKFDGKSATIGKAQLKDTDGKQGDSVAIGLILVAIDVKSNPVDKSTKTNVPNFLQRIGEAIADKPVGPLRIYLSIAITFVTVAAASIILYSGVRNSIISIGRNPLSKKSVFRALLEVIFTGILIMIIGLFAVYLLLKL